MLKSELLNLTTFKFLLKTSSFQAPLVFYIFDILISCLLKREMDD